MLYVLFCYMAYRETIRLGAVAQAGVIAAEAQVVSVVTAVLCTAPIVAARAYAAERTVSAAAIAGSRKKNAFNGRKVGKLPPKNTIYL